MTKTFKRTISIEIKKKSVYNKLEKSTRLFQHYKNLWYCIFLELHKRKQFKIKDFNSKQKLVNFMKRNDHPDFISEFINDIRNLYYNKIGADTCKSLNDVIVREIKSAVGKWVKGKKSSLPLP